MASLDTDSKPRRSFPVERRPRMLKDFLTDDSNSCSSNRFQLFPRKPCNSTVRNVLSLDPNTTYSNNIDSAPSKLRRSRSKAASTTLSALHRASEIVVKYLPFTSVRSPSILPRSISRKLSKRNSSHQRKNDYPEEISVTVKVKDILRWRSFRDLVEEEPPPLDFSNSPHRCTTTTITTTTGSTSIATGSSSSSWCDSDFTSEDLPLWCGNLDDNSGENEVEEGKNILRQDGVGEDYMEATTGTTVDPKGELLCEEKEQQSPVSVLDFPFGEDEELLSSFHHSLANMERRTCNLMQKIQELESLAELEPINLVKRFSVEENTVFEEEEETNGVEEKAEQLLNYCTATSSAESFKANVDRLLLDFFRHELSTSGKRKDDEFDCEVLRVAKAWVSGKYDGSLEGKKEGCIRDMDRGVRWNKFEEEQEYIGVEMENEVLSDLLDELFVDLLSYSL